MSAILGKKLGMTRVFDEDGAAIPVTVIEAEPNKVTAIRRAERDGYDAVQLAGEPVAERALSKGELGHLKKAGARPMRTVVEFRDVEFKAPAEEGGDAPEESDDAPAEGESGDMKIGDEVKVTSFQAGDAV